MKKVFSQLAAAAITLILGTSNSTAQWQLTGNSNATSSSFIGTTNATDFVIKTGGSASTNERMRINSSGKIGIGTNGPVAKLHVHGTETASLSSSGLFTISASGANSYNQIRLDANQIQATSTNIGTVGSNLYVNPLGGKVAIGTSAPEARLHVRSDAGERAFQVGINGSTKLMIEYNGGTALGYGSSNIPPADGLIVSGRVGIGTASPGSKFEINSDASTHPLSIKVNGYTNFRATNNGGIAIGENLSPGSATTFNPPANGLFVSGTVDIGKQNGATGYKLSVDGKVICTELKVQASSAWPDYVFADNYQLTSIDDLEKSIKTHKHLPGIPSAKEIENNGISVGEMQNKMMEKIEQLTLYLIDLEHEKDELINRIAKLEKK